ncbi:hypothetical protein JCM21900_003238 [Sporobolomyces salmonicolor]
MPSTVAVDNLPLLTNPAEHVLWSAQAEAWFTVNDLLPYIDGSASRSEAKEWTAKNAKPKAYLIMISRTRPTLTQHIHHVTNAPEVWENYEKLVERLAAVSTDENERTLAIRLISAIDWADPRLTFLHIYTIQGKIDDRGPLLYYERTFQPRRIHYQYHSEPRRESVKREGEHTTEANPAQAKSSSRSSTFEASVSRRSNFHRRGHTVEVCYREGGEMYDLGR